MKKLTLVKPKAMDNYQEGWMAVIMCIVVLVFPLIGIVIYLLLKVLQMQKEASIERLKVQVLVESMTEIFESKYKLYEDESTSSGGIPRRE